MAERECVPTLVCRQRMVDTCFEAIVAWDTIQRTHQWGFDAPPFIHSVPSRCTCTPMQTLQPPSERSACAPAAAECARADCCSHTGRNRRKYVGFGFWKTWIARVCKKTYACPVLRWRDAACDAGHGGSRQHDCLLLGPTGTMTRRFGGPSFLRLALLNSFPHSLRSLLDFLWLHLQQAATTLSQLCLPPLCRTYH